jgi:uncharacterized protein YkwD
MRKTYYSLIAILLLLLLTACTGLPGKITILGTPSTTTTSSQVQEMGGEQQLAQQLLENINQDRAANHLPALAWEPRLQGSGRQHNLVMAAGCGLQHECPNEPDLGKRISQQGVHWLAVGENIGEANPILSSTDASRMLMAIHKGMMDEKPPDDGHRQNLLSKNFHRIGIAVSIDTSHTLWVTEDFAN